MNAKAKSTEVKRLNIVMPRELHDAFKAAVAAEGKNISNVLTDFIRKYVEQRQPNKARRGGAGK